MSVGGERWWRASVTSRSRPIGHKQQTEEITPGSTMSVKSDVLIYSLELQVELGRDGRRGGRRG